MTSTTSKWRARHNIPLIVLMDKKARMISTPENNVPERYHGKDRFKAREMVLAVLRSLASTAARKTRSLPSPSATAPMSSSSRCSTEQWYVNAAEMAKPAIAAVEKGDTVFVPKNWDKTYYGWTYCQYPTSKHERTKEQEHFLFLVHHLDKVLSQFFGTKTVSPFSTAAMAGLAISAAFTYHCSVSIGSMTTLERSPKGWAMTLSSLPR